ncbi:MAG: LAGLIDADG family homing endonuclease [Nitrososphaeria archaeon]
MDKVDTQYLLGIVDSLGHFSIFTYKNYSYPKFVVYTQNRHIANLLYSFFNIGKITVKTKSRKKPIYIYSVTKYDELKKVVNFFERHRLQIKYHEFIKFKEFLNRWHPKVQKRSREESIKALEKAVTMYKEGVPVKEIVSKTGVSLNRLYIILKAYNLKRYNKVENASDIVYPILKNRCYPSTIS